MACPTPPVGWQPEASQCQSLLPPSASQSLLRLTTKLYCMKPCYCTWESKGWNYIYSLTLNYPLSRDTYRGEEQELVVYLYLMAVYFR